MFREQCKEDARTTHEEIAVQALMARCNDTPDTFARQSPIKIWAVFLFPAQFLGDLNMVMMCLFCFPLLCFLGHCFNDHRVYKYERAASFLVRYVVFFFVVGSLINFPQLLADKE